MYKYNLYKFAVRTLTRIHIAQSTHFIPNNKRSEIRLRSIRIISLICQSVRLRNTWRNASRCPVSVISTRSILCLWLRYWLTKWTRTKESGGGYRSSVAPFVLYCTSTRVVILVRLNPPPLIFISPLRTLWIANVAPRSVAYLSYFEGFVTEAASSLLGLPLQRQRQKREEEAEYTLG